MSSTFPAVNIQDCSSLPVHRGHICLSYNIMLVFAEALRERKNTKEKQEILDKLTERLSDSDSVLAEMKLTRGHKSTLVNIIDEFKSFKKMEAWFEMRGEEYSEEVEYYWNEIKYWVNKYVKEEKSYML